MNVYFTTYIHTIPYIHTLKPDLLSSVGSGGHRYSHTQCLLSDLQSIQTKNGRLIHTYIHTCTLIHTVHLNLQERMNLITSATAGSIYSQNA